MKYRRYARDGIVAIALGSRGVALCRPDGRSLHALEGTAQIVIEQADFAAVAAIFACLARDLDQDQCAEIGVEADA